MTTLAQLRARLPDIGTFVETDAGKKLFNDWRDDFDALISVPVPALAEMRKTVADCIPLVDAPDGTHILSRNDALDAADRVLTALGLSDGSRVVVPVEPTLEMLHAGARARSADYDQAYFGDDERDEMREWVAAEYRAMLSASEEPKNG